MLMRLAASRLRLAAGRDEARNVWDYAWLHPGLGQTRADYWLIIISTVPSSTNRTHACRHRYKNLPTWQSLWDFEIWHWSSPWNLTGTVPLRSDIDRHVEIRHRPSHWDPTSTVTLRSDIDRTVKIRHRPSCSNTYTDRHAATLISEKGKHVKQL